MAPVVSRVSPRGRRAQTKDNVLRPHGPWSNGLAVAPPLQFNSPIFGYSDLETETMER